MLAGLIQNISSLTRTSWLGIGPKDLLDVVIVTFLIYAVLLLLKRTHSSLILGGISVLLAIYFVARIFNLYLTQFLFQTFLTFFVIILVVVFQKELRNFFEWFSTLGRINKLKPGLKLPAAIGAIVDAIAYLAEHRIGALIVIPGTQTIERYLENGIILNGEISTALLISIFDPSSPGHDGAVIIQNGRIQKFGVHLPLAERFDQFGHMGTRHRAALGLSEHSDAMIIAVSEERGTITIAQKGKFTELTSAQTLVKQLSAIANSLYGKESSKNGFLLKLLRKNWPEKVLAFTLAAMLWFVFVVQLGMSNSTKQFDIPVEFRVPSKNLMIDQSVPEIINVTLSGNSKDFAFLKPDSLKIVITPVNISEGWKKDKITEDIIIRPPSLTVIRFNPKTIQYHLQKIQ